MFLWLSSILSPLPILNLILSRDRHFKEKSQKKGQHYHSIAHTLPNFS
jgi:hypothetical protein